MPAVQLDRLKYQIQQLLSAFSDSEQFVKKLTELFELYANRVYRPGQNMMAVRRTPMYFVPPILLRQLEFQLAPHCRQNPKKALELADALWKASHLEQKLVAAFILGQCPLNPIEAITERLLSWCNPDEDSIVLQAVLNQGSEEMRMAQPETWISLILSWLERETPSYQKMGLNALLPLVQDRNFENLPPIYRLISTVVQNPSPVYQNELVEILSALAKREPVETAYFIRQSLNLGLPQSTLRIFRRCLPAFDDQAQASLRNLLLQATASTNYDQP
jgi:hypothetical protein